MYALSSPLAMDPPDMELDGWGAGLVEGFQRIVASQPPANPAPSDSHFIKLVEVLNVTLSSMASKFKVVSLHERGLVGHFMGL